MDTQAAWRGSLTHQSGRPQNDVCLFGCKEAEGLPWRSILFPTDLHDAERALVSELLSETFGVIQGRLAPVAWMLPSTPE